MPSTTHSEVAKLNGATEEEIEDAVHYAKSSAGWSTYINGLQLDYDELQRRSLASLRACPFDADQHSVGEPERRDVESEREQIMRELVEQFRPVMDQSPDGVYLWLDEANKTCNQRLADLYGFTVEEWRKAQPFLDNFVAEEDRALYSWNYHNRVAALAFPVTFRFRGLKKDGSTFAAETDMIPISHRGYAVAYHFVRRVGK